MERYRTAIVGLAVLGGVVLISAFVLVSASQPAYACSTIWTPDPTPSPTAGATPNLGYVQPEIGHDHINRGAKATYVYCPPASGSHYNNPGVAGPIAARVYGPTDTAIPQGWVHNLEHGALVILYTGSGPGATPEGQAALKAYYEAFPPVTNCGPVVARFDEMATPYAALLWDRVLPMETFDAALVTDYWNQWGGRTNQEKACPPGAWATNPSPSPSPAASETAGPSPS